MGFVFVYVWLVMGTSVILWGFVYGYYYKVLLCLYCGYIGAGTEERRNGYQAIKLSGAPGIDAIRQKNHKKNTVNGF